MFAPVLRHYGEYTRQLQDDLHATRKQLENVSRELAALKAESGPSGAMRVEYSGDRAILIDTSQTIVPAGAPDVSILGRPPQNIVSADVPDAPLVKGPSMPTRKPEAEHCQLVVTVDDAGRVNPACMEAK